MSKGVNDNSAMLTRLRDLGACPVVITSMPLGLKGYGRLSRYENMDGVPVHRIYESFEEMYIFPQKHLADVLNIAKSLNPDLIFCSQELNMRLALLIKKYFNKPIVLLVEDAGRIYSGESNNRLKDRFLMSIFGLPSGRENYWRWLCEKADILISCHPRDKRILNILSNGKPIHYLPWPSYIPSDFKPSERREKSRGVYVGSLFPFKNAREFQWSLPLILEQTKVRQFVVIGPGPQAKIITKLKEKYGDRILYYPQISRNAALKIISSSFFAYTPVKVGGWGFIGDCWSMRTPIVMTHNDDYVLDNVNALVSHNDYHDVVENINRLYSDTELYTRLQSNGYQEYLKRTAEVVGDQLYTIFKGCL
jgi:glycosyltransferase involved in cell wall biosynthesis